MDMRTHKSLQVSTRDLLAYLEVAHFQPRLRSGAYPISCGWRIVENDDTLEGAVRPFSLDFPLIAFSHDNVQDRLWRAAFAHPEAIPHKNDSLETIRKLLSGHKRLKWGLRFSSSNAWKAVLYARAQKSPECAREGRTAFRNYQTPPRVEPTSLMAPRRRVMAEFLALVLVVACGLLGCLVALVAQDQPTRDAKPIKKRLRFNWKWKTTRPLRKACPKDQTTAAFIYNDKRFKQSW
jgi:hypothetical protein